MNLKYENLGMSHGIVFFLEILENAVPFTSGGCRKFKPNVLVEWKKHPLLSLTETTIYSSRLGYQFRSTATEHEEALSVRFSTFLWLVTSLCRIRRYFEFASLSRYDIIHEELCSRKKISAGAVN